ncbi:trans-aconitate 2-methyltransferase [Quadrisphaera sp. DSM 44207]|uniref:class I SAM-dependent methyltransferase n=1 Tax=Quadrisphaera sp. DSM 44207 TaxID=1881057 RepID=UPI00088E3FDB|nr:class I SAM-dependent methyltransferase [Quadrisphaera sp. DSM 44207]SDQ70102.1 trans-aconitate 2-methyltransferase [Quadrisphaera sp. DSM 44207]
MGRSGSPQERGGGPREWDAAAYDALPLPHERWGRQLLETLPLCGDERVLDVGAGTGRDTEALLQRLPRGHVIAVDGSAAMLDRLRQRLAAVGPERLSVLHADLREPLALAAPVDAVFSVATLHWLPEHAALFTSLAAVLRPGGLLRAEWGGAGDLAGVDAALTALDLPPVSGALTFAGADRSAQRLTAAGFVDVRVDLVPDPVRLQPGAQLEAFLATVVLGAVLDPLPQAQRSEVVRAVAARLPEPVVDYVRLRAAARAPG